MITPLHRDRQITPEDDALPAHSEMGIKPILLSKRFRSPSLNTHIAWWVWALTSRLSPELTMLAYHAIPPEGKVLLGMCSAP